MSESSGSPRNFWARCAGVRPSDQRNLLRAAGLYIAWALLFAATSQLIKRELLAPGPLQWGLAVVPSLFAIFVFLSYTRFLREADELQRAVHMEALAVGFGGGLFSLAGYRLLERAGAPAVDLADGMLFLVAFYVIGLLRATWRYR